MAEELEKSESAEAAVEKDISDDSGQDSSTAMAESLATPESLAIPESPHDVNMLLSMKIPVIVKVAERKLKLCDVMKFTIGSIIQFDKDAYQNVDLMVNNSTIGLGQPVKVGENFGLRVVQIGDITDTIRSLGGVENAEEA